MYDGVEIMSLDLPPHSQLEKGSPPFLLIALEALWLSAMLSQSSLRTSAGMSCIQERVLPAGRAPRAQAPGPSGAQAPGPSGALFAFLSRRKRP